MRIVNVQGRTNSPLKKSFRPGGPGLRAQRAGAPIASLALGRNYSDSAAKRLYQRTANYDSPECLWISTGLTQDRLASIIDQAVHTAGTLWCGLSAERTIPHSYGPGMWNDLRGVLKVQRAALVLDHLRRWASEPGLLDLPTGYGCAVAAPPQYDNKVRLLVTYQNRELGARHASYGASYLRSSIRPSDPDAPRPSLSGPGCFSSHWGES